MKRLKKTLLILLLIFPIISFSQPQMPLKEGKVFYEEIDSLSNGIKADLYNKSKVWFVNTFKSAKAVLQMDDKEAGNIMGKGLTGLDIGNVMTGSLRSYINYTININLKDNKYRIQVYDIYVSNDNNTSYTPEYCLKYPKMNKKKLERIDSNVKDLIASFKAAIDKKQEDNF